MKKIRKNMSEEEKNRKLDNAEVLRAIDDIVYGKANRTRYMSVAWEKLFEMKSSENVNFSSLTLDNEIALNEISKRFKSDFNILFKEYNTEAAKEDLLTKFAKLKALEKCFGFNFSSIDSSLFKIYEQFKDCTKDEMEEYSMKVEGLPGEKDFVLEFTNEELQDFLEQQHNGLEYHQELFEKNRLTNEFFNEHGSQIKQLINDADAEGLRSMINNFNESLPRNLKKVANNSDLFHRCVDCVDSDQNHQLLKIAEDLNDKGFANIVFSKVQDKEVRTDYIKRKVDDTNLREIAGCKVKLEHNVSERKKLHLYNPTHWGQIYRLSKDRKQINSNLSSTIENFNRQCRELLSKSPIAKLIFDSDQKVFSDLLEQKKREILREAQNASHDSLHFSEATVVTKEQIQQIDADKWEKIQQQLKQQRSEQTSMQLLNK